MNTVQKQSDIIEAIKNSPDSDAKVWRYLSKQIYSPVDMYAQMMHHHTYENYTEYR